MLIDYITSIELGLITGCIALGVYTTYRIIHFTDLTCDGSVIIGAATTAAFIQAGYGPTLATGASFCAGALTGLCTALIHTYARIPSIISGILTAYIAYSVSLHIMGSAPNIPLCGYTLLFHEHPLMLLCILCISVIASFVYFFSTNLGLRMHIAGYNPNLAQQFGFNTKVLTMLGVSLSNALIALGGSALTHYQEFADVSQGFGSLVIGLGSALVGEKILPQKPLIFPVMGCFIGSILYHAFLNIALQVTWLGLEPYDMNIVISVCMIFIMMRRKNRAFN